MYKSIQILRCILPIVKPLPWWQYVQARPCEMTKCGTVIRILFDCHNLKSCLFRYKSSDVTTPYCEYCDHRAVEDPHHVLFVCSENRDLRMELWQEIRCTLGVSLLQWLMKQMTCQHKIKCCSSSAVLGTMSQNGWISTKVAYNKYMQAWGD